jgi:hypothetical protein
MTPDPPPRLELLVPWELPTEHPLDSADRIRVGRALQRLLLALQEGSPPIALQQIAQALTDLGTVPTTIAQPANTKTSLKQPQIEEFDQYFETSHVHSVDPAGCIVQSLLVTYWRSLHLWQQQPDLDPQPMQLQKQGLISYIHLLARVFHLDLEVNYD